MSWGNAKPSEMRFKKKRGVYTGIGRYADYYFDPKKLIARSGNYSDSFTFLKRINGKLILTICPGTYYRGTVAELLKGKYQARLVFVECSLDRFKTEGLKTRYEHLFKTEADLLKKGIRNATKDRYRQWIRDTNREIAELKALGAGFPVKERKHIQRVELNRVTDENRRYDERRKQARSNPRPEDSVSVFKKTLLANSWKNVA